MSRLFAPAEDAPDPNLDLRSGLTIGPAGAGRPISQFAISSLTLLALELTSDPFEALRSTGCCFNPSSSSNSLPSGLPLCLNPLSNDPVADMTGAVRDLSATFFRTSSVRDLGGKTFRTSSSSSSSSNSLQLSLLELKTNKTEI
jgi:hypothetical protein